MRVRSLVVHVRARARALTRLHAKVLRVVLTMSLSLFARVCSLVAARVYTLAREVSACRRKSKRFGGFLDVRRKVYVATTTNQTTFFVHLVLGTTMGIFQNR